MSPRQAYNPSINSKKGGVKVRSNNIQADILNCLFDYKLHTTKEIAETCEVSQKTVKRHIQALAYSFNIQTFTGGIDRGGVRLISEQKVSVEKLTSDDLQLIIEQLESLQDSNVRIKSFINKLSTQQEIKEKAL